jgi:transcriptional regulator with XRE-family HTH domain
MIQERRGAPKVPPSMSKRKGQGIKSYADLALKVGVDRSYISRIYRGMCCPSLPVLVKMSKALGVSIDTIIKDIPAAHTMPKKTRFAKGKGNVRAKARRYFSEPDDDDE